MALDNTKTPETATLSQSELFQRFLDAPFLHSGMSGLLQPSFSRTSTMVDHFLGFQECESNCLDSDLAEQMIDDLRGCDEPLQELDNAVGDLENLLRGVRMLKREFGILCGHIRTEEPDEDSPTEVYNDWEVNPRYILPVIEQKEAE